MGETEQELVHRHERSDVAARWPVMLGGGFLLLLPLAVALVTLLMSTIWDVGPDQQERFTTEPSIPEPHLLVHPQSRLAALRAEWLQRLTTYGWVDRQQGIVHIPIDVAMQRFAKRKHTWTGQWPTPVPRSLVDPGDSGGSQMQQRRGANHE